MDNKVKHLSILGSTGSIGTNVLSIVAMFPDRFVVEALAAATSIDLLAEQIRRFNPKCAVVRDAEYADLLRERLMPKMATEIVYGYEGYNQAATLPATDMLVSAMVGSSGLIPTFAAIYAGKDVALANKESLVMSGELMMQAARSNNVEIIPVDSEHSAIFQSMLGHRKEDVRRIILTASGGPFLDLPADDFASIRPEDALKHPTWSMGAKISIDSATLMNKGLEVIEARWLFDVSEELIDVHVHPESIVHSMVEYCDGSVIAQLGVPDMRIPIAYALTYPERLPLEVGAPDFFELGQLRFIKPDLARFPCLGLAFDACKRGGTAPSVLNAANEAAVAAFLDHRINLLQIADVVEKTMASHRLVSDPTLFDILSADAWAREYTIRKIS
ncbi:MAG: 1-deoxy-D-xylulose-5-phosphate reductoisomerase [Deltaproteobacteria bacterium]|jgi:1-deoxy-D-xylulose-5-phosphate reductoisomerase|nr:1-deoxy-D-xylulose-5-phosphate reductoisomerase [Deltaproteobacteria bacterium]